MNTIVINGELILSIFGGCMNDKRDLHRKYCYRLQRRS